MGSTSILRQYEQLRIPLAEILSATNNFAKERRIGGGGFGQVFEGFLISRGNTRVAVKVLDRKFGQGDPEFWKEIMMLSEYKHENIISLMGFCDEEDQKILVYKYASRKSLDTHLDNKELTWSRRLKICIGAARGLAFLHNPPAGCQQRLLHRDIKTSNILLEEDWNVLIADFGLSKFAPANQKNTFIITGNTVGTIGYVDPEYMGGVLTKESDVYSFGVVLFEVLCGRLCIVDGGQYLIHLVRSHMKDKTLNLNHIIWCDIRDEIHPDSLKLYSKIAYACLKRRHESRPKMTDIVRDLERCLQLQEGKQAISSLSNMIVRGFEIRLDVIKLATNNFAEDNMIGEGKFSTVYRGQLYFREQTVTTVAVKRKHGGSQLNPVMWYQNLRLDYKHENIIYLLGCCDEEDEKILVYEYASKNNLDKHLQSKELTWVVRLKICIGVARGLAYIHGRPNGSHVKEIMHGNINSSSILLDEKWNAKIELPTKLLDGISGTRMVSDVYSFGVVLFEVLCGRLCIASNSQYLPKLARSCYEQKKLNEIVWEDIKDEMHPSSLEKFSRIAYDCLETDTSKRPSMDMILHELQSSLKLQEDFEAEA